MAVEARADHPQKAHEAVLFKSSNIPQRNSLDTIIQTLNLTDDQTKMIKKGVKRKLLSETLIESKATLIDICKTTPVSAHEIGHAHVIRFLGGDVLEISVIPNGNVLGYTKFRFYNSGNYEFITNLIAAAYGSRLAEEKFGIHDHSGCGGDHAQIEYYATLGEQLSRGRWKKAELKSAGKGKASLAIASLNPDDHFDQAVTLSLQKKTN